MKNYLALTLITFSLVVIFSCTKNTSDLDINDLTNEIENVIEDSLATSSSSSGNTSGSSGSSTSDTTGTSGNTGGTSGGSSGSSGSSGGSSDTLTNVHVLKF